ncbi:hypothetical protein EVAR_13467_1 [Eumeta japonica]|uniref:Nucleic-acid-binding protein from transposon X-element n=1 Tax=Eumeta variegata TaxID=151549 RepID=A0A4C1UY13_EUMVA|nr:hypothetical protein EVAR_13467_1 [Eumeta japonica]
MVLITGSCSRSITHVSPRSLFGGVAPSVACVSRSVAALPRRNREHRGPAHLDFARLPHDPACVRHGRHIAASYAVHADPRWVYILPINSLSKAKKESWRKSSQPTTASQGAVDAGKTKAAPSAAAKNNKSDEADVTAPPAPAPRDSKPPPVFVQNKDRWTELHKRYAEKNIQYSQARNSVQGLKLQAKTVVDFRNLQNLLVTQKFAFHTYSLKEEREIRVVLRGVPKEIPVEECHNCQSYGHSSRHCFHSARCVKCPGDHGTAQCTRNKDTDGPPACVLCKQKGLTANYLGCPRAPKRAPPPEKAAPRRAPARAVSSTLSYAAAGPRNAPPAAKNNPTFADDLSQLMSIITVIDTSELAILAKKFRTAANPTEKLICLIEHASLGYAFHTYSSKEERKIKVVLRGVPKEIPVEEIKEDLQSQNLPVQSVRRILNHSREPLDLVLVFRTVEANDKAKGNKAQCTRNKDTHDPSACILCKQKGHTAFLLTLLARMPACPKKSILAREGRAASSTRAPSQAH